MHTQYLKTGYIWEQYIYDLSTGKVLVKCSDVHTKMCARSNVAPVSQPHMYIYLFTLSVLALYTSVGTKYNLDRQQYAVSRLYCVLQPFTSHSSALH